METDALVLAAGVAGLWGGTELAVRGAARLGRAFGVSEGFLGLTVFAIGTDIPEWLVAIEGGWQRLDGIATSGLVVGNAIGSTIAQGALVLGIAGLGGTLRLAPREVRRDGIPLLLAAVVLFVLAWDGSVTRAEGAVLMATYAVYATTLLRAEGVLFSVRRAPGAHRA